MPKTTPNMNLYKVDGATDGNDTFNIDLALNDNWDKIDAAIGEVREDLGNVSVPPASLTQAGITRLSSATNSTSETEAATPKAVKAAYDRGSAGVTAATTAETNAKNYADANFYKKTDFTLANRVRNSSGLLWLSNWKSGGLGNWSVGKTPHPVHTYFFTGSVVNQGQFAILDSDPMPVSSGLYYNVACDFYTIGNATASAAIEIKKGSDVSGGNIASITATPSSDWHRKSVSFLAPAGESSVVLRLVVSTQLVGTQIGFSRISMVSGSSVSPYSSEGDLEALFQLSVDLKTKIANAINGKGGTANSSMNGDQLATAITNIPTARRAYLSAESGEVPIPINNTHTIVVMNIGVVKNAMSFTKASLGSGTLYNPGIRLSTIGTGGYSDDSVRTKLVLRNSKLQTVDVIWGAGSSTTSSNPGDYIYVHSMNLDVGARLLTFAHTRGDNSSQFGVATISIPESFDLTAPLDMVSTHLYNSTFTIQTRRAAQVTVAGYIAVC